jgi:hypothetical protein
MTRQILMLLNFLQSLRKMSTWWFLFLLRIKYESQLCFKANIKMREAAQIIKRKEMYQMQWNWKNSTQVEQWTQEMVYLHFYLQLSSVWVLQELIWLKFIFFKHVSPCIKRYLRWQQWFSAQKGELFIEYPFTISAIEIWIEGVGENVGNRRWFSTF